jgi:hypothetical protein
VRIKKCEVYISLIITICNGIYLNLSAPTMQNKSYAFGFSATSAKNI